MRFDEGIVDSYNLDIAVLDPAQRLSMSSELAKSSGKANGGVTDALRNTILPMRPKPLMPTSVSDMIVLLDEE